MSKQSMVHDFTEVTGHWKNQTMCLRDGTVVLATKEVNGGNNEVEVYTLDKGEHDGSVLRGSFPKKAYAVMFAEYLSLQSAGKWDLIKLAAWLLWRDHCWVVAGIGVLAVANFACWLIT